MRWITVLFILFFGALVPAWAAEKMSLIEEALHAVTVSEEISVAAQSITPTSRERFWMPGQVELVSNTVQAVSGNNLTASVVSQLQVVDPVGLTAAATAEIIALAWTNTGTVFSGFLGYRVCKAEVGKTLEVITASPQPTTSFVDRTVTAKTHYLYQVFAVDGKGTTFVASHKISAVLKPSQPPGIPSEIKAETLEERVRITWKKTLKTSHDVSGYRVMRALPGAEKRAFVTTIVISKEEFYDDTGMPGVEYQYQVLTVDSKGQTSAASKTVLGKSRPRNRNGLVLTSTAYRGLGHDDLGFTADMQFTYYIGTLYGEQDEELSEFALYLDPISLWLLTADVKYTFLTEKQNKYFPLAAALGGKASLLLFAGQQSEASGSFTFSEKTEFDYVWGGYLSLSRSFGNWGIHGGYSLGSLGDPFFYLSKYMRYGETERTRNLFYMGIDFPVARRMNAALEIMYPLNSELISQQHPVLINLHVDRLFNFDVAYLHWNQGWAFLGYFNIRFTVFPGE
ncbi:hypothetical protein K8S19_00320 [bacterium]|nr:hypothetical protein [bacterium]